jgi:hypothetical protein
MSINPRLIFRWIHIVFSIPILGYIYSPFERLPDYAPATRFVFLPVMVLTGLWMWKGHLVSKTCFEETGLTSRCSEPMPAQLDDAAYAGFSHQPRLGTHRPLPGGRSEA